MTVSIPRPPAISLPPSPPYDPKDILSPVILQQLGPLTPSTTPRNSGSASIMAGTASGPAPKPSRRASCGPAGARSASPTKHKARPKVQLEDFELIRVLGRGCAGRVLLVRHSCQNTVHAMKAISKRSVLASDELEHILTELDILKRLAINEPTNDFVTRLNFSFTDRENFYFVMDFYPGGDLATQLEIFGTLGAVRTRFYAADLVLGLEDLHRQGVILRDLKPENILLNASGHCVLADFGLSREFPYRGEPEPLQVPQYQGEMVLPHWAGQGMGSVRLSPGGRPRVVVDRTWSFVGTTEYLSPEVVKGQDYSYAIDWWSLGCILFECLIGRVPFRSGEDEPAQVLYNRICNEPWDWMLDDPKYRHRRESELDVVTEGFLDALLQKDPMRRLTEPCVKEHFYFSHIDWELVRSGEYVDPHPLQLHPLAEYNTRYFPKLCLEQDPNVDMSTHNPDELDENQAGGGAGRKLTALNDENTYKFEQLKYRGELEGFYWSRDDCEWEVPEEGEAEPEPEAAIVTGAEPEVEVEGDVEMEIAGDEEAGPGSGLSTETGSFESSSGVDSELPEQVDGDEDSILSTEVDEEAGDIDMVLGTATGERENEKEVVIDIDITGSTPSGATPLPTSTTPTLTPVALSGAMSSMQLSSPIASPDRLITPDTSSTDIPVRIRNGSEATPSPSPEKIKPAATSKRDESTVVVNSDNGTPAISPTKILEHPISARPLASSNKSIPIPIPLIRPAKTADRLPSGPPASGLSVSDIVSIPSPGIDGPRLIRRHPQLTSIDSVPAARLSIDMHGTITQLGEDDWEALEVDESIPSAQNGVPPSSFFTRLRRRPSTLITSGLRRSSHTAAARSSESSRESSPTKSTTPRPAVIFGTTKKALGRLKAFPLLRSRRNSDDAQSSSQQDQAERNDAEKLSGEIGPRIQSDISLSTTITSPSPSNRTSPSPERLRAVRPDAVIRRHTESGWFERKISSTGRYFKHGSASEKDRRSIPQTLSSEEEEKRQRWGTGHSSSSEGNLVKKGTMLGLGLNGGGPPRVELKAMGSPVDWEFRVPDVPPKDERGTATDVAHLRPNSMPES